MNGVFAQSGAWDHSRLVMMRMPEYSRPAGELTTARSTLFSAMKASSAVRGLAEESRRGLT